MANKDSQKNLLTATRGAETVKLSRGRDDVTSDVCVWRRNGIRMKSGHVTDMTPTPQWLYPSPLPPPSVP